MQLTHLFTNKVRKSLDPHIPSVSTLSDGRRASGEDGGGRDNLGRHKRSDGTRCQNLGPETQVKRNDEESWAISSVGLSTSNMAVLRSISH